jgi:hypothetical protein
MDNQGTDYDEGGADRLELSPRSMGVFSLISRSSFYRESTPEARGTYSVLYSECLIPNVAYIGLGESRERPR